MDELKSGREQHWSEIDSDEKIERLRKEVKRLERVISEMRKQMFKLSRHLHSTNGELVSRLSLDEPLSAPSLRYEDSDDVYF